MALSDSKRSAPKKARVLLALCNSYDGFVTVKEVYNLSSWEVNESKKRTNITRGITKRHIEQALDSFHGAGLVDKDYKDYYLQQMIF